MDYDLEHEYQKLRPLVIKIYRNFSKKVIEKEDFEQEARIILWKTLQSYEKKTIPWSKGVCFKANLKRWVYSYHRKITAQKRTSITGEMINFYHEPYTEDTMSEEKLELLDENVINKMKFKQFFFFFISNYLSRRQQLILFQEIGAEIENNHIYLGSEKSKKRLYKESRRNFLKFYKTEYEQWG